MSRQSELAALARVVDTGALSNRNLIINGAMQVAQRGTSVTGVTSGGYRTVDRFRTDHNGFTGSYTQDTDVPSEQGFSNSFKIEVTTAASSDAGRLRLDTRIEAQDLRNSGWNYTSSSSYITFSCWVKSSLAGTYYVGFRTNDGTARQYTEAFTLVANTWKKLAINIPGDSSVSFDNDNGLGALLALHIDETTSETDVGHTLNGWQNYIGTNRTPDFSQDWSETLNATFHTTGWQLEVGDTETEFEHRSYGDQLARCQRYYQFNITNNGYTNTTTSCRLSITGSQEMRAVPSLTIANGTNAVEDYGIASRNMSSLASLSGGTTLGGLVDAVIASSTAAKPHALFPNAIAMDAEL